MFKLYVISVLLFIFLLDSSVISQDIEVIEGITILTDLNFDDFVKSNKHVLVKFFAPWCGHCKTMAPLYKTASKELTDSGINAVLAELDSTIHTRVSQKYEIQGYPTMLWFKDGVNSFYDGGREKDSFVTWVSTHADPDYIPPPDAAVDLTDASFADVIDDADLTLVMFYAPWCGQCKKIKPFFETAAKELRGIMPLFKVDATVEKKLAKKYDITSYPTLFVFRSGDKYKYNGPTQNAGITDYMKTQVGEASVLLTTLKQYKKYPAKEKVTVIGFLDEEDPEKEALFKHLANKLRDEYKFGHFYDRAIAKKNYILTNSSLTVVAPTLFPTDQGNSLATIGISTEKSMEDFIAVLNVPLVGEFTEENQKYYENKYPLVYFFYTVDYSHEGKRASEFWRNRIVKIAKDYKDKVTFAIADDEKFPGLVKMFDHDNSGEDLNIGMMDKTGLHFKMREFEIFDEQAVREFIDGVVEGRARPYLRSEKIPKKAEPAGKLKKIVARNFEMIMNDATSDKFIFMFKEGSADCEKVLPIMQQIAKDFKNVKDLMVTKFDAFKNEIPIMKFKEKFLGMPTIFYVKADDSNNPIAFEGKTKELKDFVAFIKEHATVSIDNADFHDEL